MKKLPLELIPKDKTAIKYMILIGRIGFVMVISIVLFSLLGYFVSKKNHFERFAIPVCIIIGVLIGFYLAYQLLKKHFEKDNDDN